MTADYDPKRRKPYKTGELALIFEVHQATIRAWIDRGRFGKEGEGWRWTEGGKGRGDRIVSAKVVHRVIDRGF